MSAVVSSVVWMAMPSVSMACAVCGPGDEQSRMAFLISTIALSLLPLGMMGGLIFWLWRRAVKHAEAQEVEIQQPDWTRLVPDVPSPDLSK